MASYNDTRDQLLAELQTLLTNAGLTVTTALSYRTARLERQGSPILMCSTAWVDDEDTHVKTIAFNVSYWVRLTDESEIETAHDAVNTAIEAIRDAVYNRTLKHSYWKSARLGRDRIAAIIMGGHQYDCGIMELRLLI